MIYSADVFFSENKIENVTQRNAEIWWSDIDAATRIFHTF